MTILDELHPTLTVRQTAELLGIGLRQTYEAIGRGEIPAIRVGRRLIVPTSRLLELLGVPREVSFRPQQFDA